MKIDITSMFFNSKIEGKTATAAWGTSIGQSKTNDCRIETKVPGVVDLVVGMTYKCRTDVSLLDKSKLSDSRELLLCSVFDKISVNEHQLYDSKYTLLLTRENTDSHPNRLNVSYAPYISFDGYKNSTTIEKMAKALGCSSQGCWFVYDISVINQNELHFSAVVVDKDNAVSYNSTSQDRSQIWKDLVLKQTAANEEDSLDNLASILAKMYSEASAGKQVAAIHYFGIKYGEKIVDRFKAAELIKKAGLNNSYETELNKSFNIFRLMKEDGSAQMLSDSNISKEENNPVTVDIKEAFHQYLLSPNRFKASDTGKIYWNVINSGRSEVQFLYEIIEDNFGIRCNEIYAIDKYEDAVKLWNLVKPDPRNQAFQNSICSAILNKYKDFLLEYHSAENDSIIEFPSDMPFQQISYGAPGTGKSHGIEKEVKRLYPKDAEREDYVIRTTFHPDSDYASFVGCYKPSVKDGEITYSFIPQSFVQAYTKAWENLRKPVFLVIEEINRGNCAQIFGDLFQLLDRADDGYSSYSINADQDLQDYLAKYFEENVIDQSASASIRGGKKLCLPPNLYIWATMNTSDQSLFPIDSAFKRRWDWKYKPINTSEKNWSIDVNGQHYSWTSFLDQINKEIEETTSSEDKKLGFFFCKAKNGVVSADRFVSKVLFYLYNDVFKDYGLEREFLKDTEDGNRTISFQSFYNAADGSINEAQVEKLLKNLEVQEYVPQEEAEDEETGDGELSVVLNGSKIQGKGSTNVYVNTLVEIGLERIYNECSDIRLVDYPYPPVMKEQGMETHYRVIDGYSVMTGIRGDRKEKMLKLIGERLNLNIEIKDEAVKDLPLAIRFEDGLEFTSKNLSKSDLFVSVLKQIGLDRVEPLLNVEPLPFSRLGCPIVSKKKYDAIENSGRMKYMEVDGYYVIATIKDSTKIPLLKYLKEKLDLKFEIESPLA